MKQYFLMKAHVMPTGSEATGRLYSTKLDGDRAFWDGGISRGMSCREVPWAYTAKHSRYKVEPRATGLWSSYAQPIQAPDWFLDGLPSVSLDGELFAGHGQHERLHGIVSKLVPVDDEWQSVEYRVFDSPPMSEFCVVRTIETGGMKLKINPDAWQFAKSRVKGECPHKVFGLVAQWLASQRWSKHVHCVKQTLILSDSHLEDLYSASLEEGAEGGMMRTVGSLWLPQRSHTLWKKKPFFDAEGTVVGFTTGRVTDKGSRNLGKIGAVILSYNGKRLEVSGMDDAHRELHGSLARDWAFDHPGQDVPVEFDGSLIKQGAMVTFKYRELSPDGIPKEARFWRIRSGS